MFGYLKKTCISELYRYVIRMFCVYAKLVSLKGVGDCGWKLYCRCNSQSQPWRVPEYSAAAQTVTTDARANIYKHSRIVDDGTKLAGERRLVGPRTYCPSTRHWLGARFQSRGPSQTRRLNNRTNLQQFDTKTTSAKTCTIAGARACIILILTRAKWSWGIIRS
jgi:hypothetical protein